MFFCRFFVIINHFAAICKGLSGAILTLGQGAYRVHGGSFAGTVQAFVPLAILQDFQTNMERVLGKGACHILSICPQGGIELTPKPIGTIEWDKYRKMPSAKNRRGHFYLLVLDTSCCIRHRRRKFFIR